MKTGRYIDWRTAHLEPETFATLALVVRAGERIVKLLVAAPGGFVPIAPLPSEQEKA